MNFGFLKRRKFWIRSMIALILIPVIVLTVLVSLLYWKQDQVVKELLQTLNDDFAGHFEIKESHISPFENFPYISIDIVDMVLYENESKE